MGSPKNLLHAILREQLYMFIIKVFEILESGTEFLENWHIKTIAYYLQQNMQGNNHRLIIAIGPRYLKSFCASVAFPIWILGRDPTAKIICVSYSDDLALHFSRLRRTALENPFIKTLFPKLRISKRKNTEKEIVTTAGGVIFSTSITGTMTGRGADYIIIDDPIKPGEAMSDTERGKVNEWYRHTAFSRLNNKNTGRIIIVSQRVHHDDLIGHLLETEENDWTVVKIPAIAPEDETFPIGKNETYKRKESEPLHAERESLEVLKKIKHSVGSFVFEAQYQQNPVPLGGVLFDPSWFVKEGRMPDWASFSMVFDSWDTASGIGPANAYSVCTTWGIRGHEVWLLKCQRYRLAFPDLIDSVMLSAREHRAHGVLVEYASSGVQIVQSLSKASINVIPIRPEGDKETRAIKVTPMIRSGKVHIPAEAPWLAEFLNEVTKFPYSKYKDQVDSMTQFLLAFQDMPRTNLGVRITDYSGGLKRVYTDSHFRRSTYYDRMGGSFPD